LLAGYADGSVRVERRRARVVWPPGAGGRRATALADAHREGRLSTILKALRRLEEKAPPKAARCASVASAPHLAAQPPHRLDRSRGGARARRRDPGGAIWWLFGRTSADPDRGEQRPRRARLRAPPPATAPPGTPFNGPPEQAFDSDVEMVDRPNALPRLAVPSRAGPDPTETGLGTPGPGAAAEARVGPRSPAGGARRARAQAARWWCPPRLSRRSDPGAAQPNPTSRRPLRGRSVTPPTCHPR
jgi:hypothetical protein